MDETGGHILFVQGYYHIQHNKVLAIFDTTGWYEPNPILWRKKYERIKKFRKRCFQYIKENKRFGIKYMSHKQGITILMKNIKREQRYAKKMGWD